MITALTLSFSVIAGIAVGMAIRFASKIVMIVSGVFIVLMMFLQLQGWLYIDWVAIGDSFNTAFESGKPALEAFLIFIGSQLPKAALFSAGLVWAIRRK